MPPVCILNWLPSPTPSTTSPPAYLSTCVSLSLCGSECSALYNSFLSCSKIPLWRLWWRPLLSLSLLCSSLHGRTKKSWIHNGKWSTSTAHAISEGNFELEVVFLGSRLVSCSIKKSNRNGNRAINKIP